MAFLCDSEAGFKCHDLLNLLVDLGVAAFKSTY